MPINYCPQLHTIVRNLQRFKFPYDKDLLPHNGIYVIFEKGEFAHGGERIVRIGTHTGKNQLRSRLNQHFSQENKDRSVFRKNIGRSILNKGKDTFLKYWEIDLTPKTVRKKYLPQINNKKLAQIERAVTKHMQKNFSFTVFEVNDKNGRLELESKLISTVSLCNECGPSKKWLGFQSPKKKIRESGLWLVNELYKDPLHAEDFNILLKITRQYTSSKFVTNIQNLKHSVKNFMAIPELWKNAIGSHPKYFLHCKINGKDSFGLSKFCVFNNIELSEYISYRHNETDGTTAREHIRKITQQDWVPIYNIDSVIQNKFKKWFFSFFPSDYKLDKIFIISLK